jgi:hypothetical protein
LAWANAPDVDSEITEAELAKTLYRHGTDGIRDRLRHRLARERDEGHADVAATRRLLAIAASFKRPVFPLGGKDLVAAGVEAGPAVGKRLRALEERWVESDFKLSREALLSLPG